MPCLQTWQYELGFPYWILRRQSSVHIKGWGETPGPESTSACLRIPNVQIPHCIPDLGLGAQLTVQEIQGVSLCSESWHYLGEERGLTSKIHCVSNWLPTWGCNVSAVPGNHHRTKLLDERNWPFLAHRSRTLAFRMTGPDHSTIFPENMVTRKEIAWLVWVTEDVFCWLTM